MRTETLEFMDGTSKEIGVSMAPPHTASIDQVINAYVQATGLSLAELVGPSKAPGITACRHELMYLIRKLDPSASFSLIGRFIGKRDMATVHEAIAKVEQRIKENPGYAAELEAQTRTVMEIIGDEARRAAVQVKPWQLLAADHVLRDEQMNDAEARKVALSFIEQLVVTHG